MKINIPMGISVFKSFCAVMIGPMQFVFMCMSKSLKLLLHVSMLALSQGSGKKAYTSVALWIKSALDSGTLAR